MRTVVFAGMAIGSTVGDFVPSLWGGSALSVAGVLLSIVGAIGGIWAGVRVGQGL